MKFLPLFLLCVLCGCTHQAEINRLHTALASQHQMQMEMGRGFENVNTVADRFNRETLTRLKELER